ncbi:hypothetical protein ACIGW8_37980 [Streptomyces sioyaensis]|uniref:hypothetical protein n=1 Tax=Streptomyces sioyaensis TaxID=67364 RepID=UPI0037D2395A
MTNDEPRSGLPIEFLQTIAAEAGPDSPPVRMAAERAQALPDGQRRDGLLLALLLDALSSSAPKWMLKAAVDSDLGKETPPYPGSSMPLATAALVHPSCPNTLRKEALQRCSVPQLAVLGRESCGDRLAGALVTELKRRGPHRQPMTPELLQEPSTSQLILRDPYLHDIVFSAALDLLPEFPRLTTSADSEAEDVMTRYDAHMVARKAWETMWEHVVTLHTSRHRQLVEWAEDGHTTHVIREHLLGTVPWDVEPSLLEEIATDDLVGFAVRDLITRVCRLLRDGVSEEDVRSQLADEFGALEPHVRRRVEEFFDRSDDHLTDAYLKYGLRAAVSWAESAAVGSWRFLLSPSEAKTRYGEPHTWRASEELLVTLGRRFAATTLSALRLWEPDPDPGRPSPRDLRWLHAMLLHLPHVTEEVPHHDMSADV